MGETYRDKLWELAVGQYGYVTAADAHDMGIPVVELGKLAARGRLERVGFGVYRFAELPAEPRGHYLEAVLRVGADAHLAGDAVLSLLGLGLVNPQRITVGTPRRNRTKVPDWIRIVRDDVRPDELTAYEGIPSTTVAAALRSCIATVMPERLLDAVDAAEREGLVIHREAQALRDEIGSR